MPATVAVIKGQVHVGLDEALLHSLAEGGSEELVKISRRDFPYDLHSVSFDLRGLNSGLLIFNFSFLNAQNWE